MGLSMNSSIFCGVCVGVVFVWLVCYALCMIARLCDFINVVVC